MKKIILIIVISFFSCKRDQRCNDVNDHIINQQIKREVDSSISEVQSRFVIDELVGSRLIGMESNEEEKENNPYKKYSVDFTGACYSSDLCVIQINDKRVIIQNYYDPDIMLDIKIKNYKSIGNQLILSLDDESLTEIKFIKILDDIPLYELKVKGEISEEIRISRFLAKENIIPKFGGIDCGDFDG